MEHKNSLHSKPADGLVVCQPRLSSVNLRGTKYNLITMTVNEADGSNGSRRNKQ